MAGSTSKHDRAADPIILPTRAPRLTRRRLLTGSAALAGGAMVGSAAGAVAAPGNATSRIPLFNISRQQKAELVFTYWGSPQEQKAVADMTKNFNDKNPDIDVKAQYVAIDGYRQKLTTMLAGGSPPDVAYQFVGLAFDWAVDGKTLDLTPYFQKDPESAQLLPNTTYTYNGGKVMSTSLAIAISLAFWNKKIFKDAGVDAPPTSGETAWTWDQFVDIAKKLTTDRDGHTAADPDFDAGKIKTYGCTLPPLYPMLWSNGGDLASEDGTKFTMNSPESVEVLQKMQDLIWVHHVTPSPQASKSMGLNGIAPTTDVLMETGKLAIDFNGMWKTLDYSHHKDLEWGMGVLPKFQQPVTNRGGTAVTIQSACKFPDAAYEFYRWRYSPERIDLYEIGLWMPIEKQYYTDPAKIKEWLDPAKGVYPPEAQDVLVTYGANFAPKQDVGYWLKNLDQIQTEVLTPALDNIWNKKGTAQEIMDDAAKKAAPMMKGRW